MNHKLIHVIVFTDGDKNGLQTNNLNVRPLMDGHFNLISKLNEMSDKWINSPVD